MGGGGDGAEVVEEQTVRAMMVEMRIVEEHVWHIGRRTHGNIWKRLDIILYEINIRSNCIHHAFAFSSLSRVCMETR